MDKSIEIKLKLLGFEQQLPPFESMYISLSSDLLIQILHHPNIRVYKYSQYTFIYKCHIDKLLDKIINGDIDD